MLVYKYPLAQPVGSQMATGTVTVLSMIHKLGLQFLGQAAHLPLINIKVEIHTSQVPTAVAH